MPYFNITDKALSPIQLKDMAGFLNLFDLDPSPEGMELTGILVNLQFDKGYLSLTYQADFETVDKHYLIEPLNYHKAVVELLDVFGLGHLTHITNVNFSVSVDTLVELSVTVHPGFGTAGARHEPFKVLKVN